MESIVNSVGSIVEAGVKGWKGLADGYMNGNGENGQSTQSGQPNGAVNPKANGGEDDKADHVHNPIDIRSTSTTTPDPTSQSVSSTSSNALSSTENIIRAVGVPSGWIHIQATYLEDGIGNGKETIRSFSLVNLVDTDVTVEVGSDLGEQLVFWLKEEDTPISSSASAVSSTPSTSASADTKLNITIKAQSSTRLSFAFRPSPTATVTSPLAFMGADDFTSTPRAFGGTGPATYTSDISPISSSIASSHYQSDAASSSGSNHSGVTGSRIASGVSGGSSSGRRNEPLHRAFAVHGLVWIRASKSQSGALSPSQQLLNIPFFATVCKSLFTAALIDPSSGLVASSQQSDGQMTVDFGSDSVVGQDYHRDILLVNRSDCELVWTTSVVSSKFKDAVWFSLRDLDSENVFGVDASAQPVPLPALSSRHLRLELRVRDAMDDFAFDFLISNVNQTDNTVTCRAIGSTQAEAVDHSLKVLSGSNLDFGQISDGVWARKLINCKNTGSKAVDVKFATTLGSEVVFRLAGVAGDDMEEEVLDRPRNPRQTSSNQLSRMSTRDDHRGRQQSERSSSRSREGSVTSSGDATSSDPSQPASYALHHHGSNERLGRYQIPGAYDFESASNKSHSRPPSRALSRVNSHVSSDRYNDGAGSDEEETEPPFFSGGDPTTSVVSSGPASPAPVPAPLPDVPTEKDNADQFEELTMRPGNEYRILVMYRPSRDATNPPEIAGAFRQSSFKIFLDSYLPAKPNVKSRRIINCVAESCTSLIEISTGRQVDFGEVTVGASKSTTIGIKNLSALSARVEIAAISKVLSTNRNVIVIPPFEIVEEKIEFFPRRINDKYEKQIFVRNLLNRANDQLLEIRSKNVDVYNLTIHSHLYRILTPSGSNFLDFGSVVINSPTARSVQLQNLTQASLFLDLSASAPEDVDLYVKVEDAPTPIKTQLIGRYAELEARNEKTAVANGEMKERFMETLMASGEKAEPKAAKPKAKAREKSEPKSGNDKEGQKQPVGAAVAAALRKGGRGKPVQLYENAVVFKDRNLLEDHEYLDLASGPPMAAHRSSPRSKRTTLLDSIALEDRSKLSGQHPKVPALDFAASAKATGLLKKDAKIKKTKSPGNELVNGVTSTVVDPRSPPRLTASSAIQQIVKGLSPNSQDKLPALTGRRAEPKIDVSPAIEVSKMSVDELLHALELQDSQRASMTHSTLEEEEQFVRRHVALRKELSNFISTGKLVPARSVSIQARSTRRLIAIMTPNGSTRPHITTKPKRSDSRIFIRLVDFDRSLLSHSSGSSTDLTELPVRDLVLRSSCVRSVLEVQQSSINFGQCEKGEAKSKTIVIQNKSDCIGLFRLRTSGSIASGDLKLGLGRLGVIAAFGRKEVENFNFVPSLGGNYQENLMVDNVLDSFNDQHIAIKAMVRKQPALAVEPATLDLGLLEFSGKQTAQRNFILTNTSKVERTFVIEVQEPSGQSFAQLSLSRDDRGGGTILSKGEEEEVETLLQKLKGAQRKGKMDKITKYESRLSELGISRQTTLNEMDVEGSSVGSVSPGPKHEVPPPTASEAPSINGSGYNTPADIEPPPQPSTSRQTVSTLTVTLQPNEKTKINTEIRPILNLNDEPSQPLRTGIKVYDRKNTDETLTVQVSASFQAQSTTASTSSMSPSHSTSQQDPIHQSIMRHSLTLTYLCPISQTAFCVGSTLFLPDTSPFFSSLRPHFPSFPEDDPDPAGLILADGYSRQIPGNTHAEANALNNFRSKYAELLKTSSNANLSPVSSNISSASSTASTTSEGTQTGSCTLPAIADVLHDSSCYATMEPCSMRTSGGPSCALELVKARVKAVYLGVEEPPDFVNCEGVRILQEGGVEVVRVVGLEEECLKAARRGRN